MFGMFKATRVVQGGLLWKVPWRMSSRQKYRHRKRLQAVDSVIETVSQGLKEVNETCEIVQKLNDPAIFPKESEMRPIDKYTVYNKHARSYRKGIHKVPKWTKLSIRVNPDYV